MSLFMNPTERESMEDFYRDLGLRFFDQMMNATHCNLGDVLSYPVLWAGDKMFCGM